MEPTVIWNIILGTETLDSGTLLTAMTTLIDIAICQVVGVAAVLFNLYLSINITVKESTSLLEKVRGNISVIEGRTKYPQVGCDGRDHSMIIIIVGYWKMRRVMIWLVVEVDLVLWCRWESWRRGHTW